MHIQRCFLKEERININLESVTVFARYKRTTAKEDSKLYKKLPQFTSHHPPSLLSQDGKVIQYFTSKRIQCSQKEEG